MEEKVYTLEDLAILYYRGLGDYDSFKVVLDDEHKLESGRQTFFTQGGGLSVKWIFDAEYGVGAFKRNKLHVFNDEKKEGAVEDGVIEDDMLHVYQHPQKKIRGAGGSLWIYFNHRKYIKDDRIDILGLANRALEYINTFGIAGLAEMFPFTSINVIKIKDGALDFGDVPQDDIKFKY